MCNNVENFFVRSIQMTDQMLKYSEHFETIIALVTYLAVCNRYSDKYDKTIDNANAWWLANHLGIEENEVEVVLDGYKGLFRRSKEKYGGDNYEEQFRYSLLLRYAHRSYTDQNAPDVSKPLTNEELFSLLNFISNKSREEQEEKHHLDNSRNQKMAMYIAVLSAMIAAGASIIAALSG